MSHENYLIISALGLHCPDVINKFTQKISSHGGNIISTRMSSMGSEFAIYMLLSGSWGSIAKIEAIIPKLEEKLEISVTAKRTDIKVGESVSLLPYTANITTTDKPDLLNYIVKFFVNNGIAIEDIIANTSFAPNGTKVLNLAMRVLIDTKSQISSIRDEFILHCDELNLDSSLEPYRE